jgi:tetratricopeptide (TPR) repeat protein
MIRRLILGVIFVAIFFVFYAWFGQPQYAQSGPAENGFSLLALVGVSFTVTFFALFLFFLSRNVRATRVHNEGVLLCQQGRVLEALAKFEFARTRLKISLTSMSVGFANLALWRLESAIEALEESQAREKKPMAVKNGVEDLTASYLSLALALKGDVPAAQAALGRTAPTGYSVVAEAVLACRTGNWAAAQARLASGALQVDQLTGSLRALSEALNAWASVSTGTAGGSVNRERLFHESDPSSLRQAWPELVDFVDRRAA